MNRPATSPAAPASFSTPIGNVSHDVGTPARAMPGRIGRKCSTAQVPENRFAAAVTSATVM